MSFTPIAKCPPRTESLCSSIEDYKGESGTQYERLTRYEFSFRSEQALATACKFYFPRLPFLNGLTGKVDMRERSIVLFADHNNTRVVEQIREFARLCIFPVDTTSQTVIGVFIDRNSNSLLSCPRRAWTKEEWADGVTTNLNEMVLKAAQKFVEEVTPPATSARAPEEVTPPAMSVPEAQRLDYALMRGTLDKVSSFVKKYQIPILIVGAGCLFGGETVSKFAQATVNEMQSRVSNVWDYLSNSPFWQRVANATQQVIYKH